MVLEVALQETNMGILLWETTINKEVKVQGGPMLGGYSVDLAAMNIFVKNSHLLAKTTKSFERTQSPSYFFET